MDRWVRIVRIVGIVGIVGIVRIETRVNGHVSQNVATEALHYFFGESSYFYSQSK